MLEKVMYIYYDGLKETGPPILGPQLAELFQEGLGVTSLEKVCHWGGL